MSTQYTFQNGKTFLARKGERIAFNNSIYDLPDRRFASFSNLGDNEFWIQSYVRYLQMLKLFGVKEISY